jgi:hypothetical protein
MAYIGASPAPKMPELDDNTVETNDIKDGAVTAAKLAAGAAVPSQSGNSGKYLTTNGTSASWAPLTSPSKAGGTINVNSTTATESYTFPSGTNGLSVGPITLADGVSVTVASGQRWVII